MSMALGLGRMCAMLPASVLSQGPGGSHMDGHRHVMHFWGGGIVMWILALVVIGIVVYFLVHYVNSKQASDTSHETPLEILEKRYARGEITKDQFDEMKRSL